MRHPTKAQVADLIANFEQVICRHPNGRLDMAEVGVHEPDGVAVCGTVHCHAGWYAVSYLESAEESARCDDGENYDYTDGQQWMAETLGFTCSWELESWAENHPSIWGNSHGGVMFSNTKAFITVDTPLGAADVRDIVDFWKDVKERLPE